MPSLAPSWDGPAPFAMTPDSSSVPCAWPRADEHARGTPVPDARSTTRMQALPTWRCTVVHRLHGAALWCIAPAGGHGASIGSVGDAYDNALAEATIGRDTTECLRPGSPCARGPLASLTDLEEVTSAWVYCYDTRRLLHHLGRRPPVEVVQGTLAAERPSPRPFTRNGVCTEPGVVRWDL